MRRHEWNRFPPGSKEETEDKMATTEAEFRKTFGRAHNNPVQAPSPVVFCGGCAFPVGREEARFDASLKREPLPYCEACYATR